MKGSHEKGQRNDTNTCVVRLLIHSCYCVLLSVVRSAMIDDTSSKNVKTSPVQDFDTDGKCNVRYRRKHHD